MVDCVFTPSRAVIWVLCKASGVAALGLVCCQISGGVDDAVNQSTWLLVMPREPLVLKRSIQTEKRVMALAAIMDDVREHLPTQGARELFTASNLLKADPDLIVKSHLFVLEMQLW